MSINRAAIRARVQKTIEADLAKGDTPGHEFHGNQYAEGSGSSKDAEAEARTQEIVTQNRARAQEKYDLAAKMLRPLDKKTPGAPSYAKGHHGNRYACKVCGEKFSNYIDLRAGGNATIRHILDHARSNIFDKATYERTPREAGGKPLKYEGGTRKYKHARPDHHVDQERSPRGTFGGHRSTAHSDDANSFMGTPNPDSATDMESSYGYHGPAASVEAAIAEDVTFNGDHGGETGELQGDFESGQQGIPQPTLWGLLSLSNRRAVKPVDGEPNVFDDVTRYINTVSGQPDTVLIDPGVTPMEQR